jgi:WXG100 family type VII secretion target
MANRISITPEELRTAAGNFTTKAGEVTDIITFLQGEVSRLESTWDGAAQDQFFLAFTDMTKVLQQFPEVCNGITGQLNAVAQTIEDTDAALASQLKG